MRRCKIKNYSEKVFKNKSKAIPILLALILPAAAAFAQGGNTGGIKGKVSVKGQGPTADVAVTVHQGEREVAHAVTDSKGEFLITGLAPGVYGITLRKTGLSVGSLEDIKV